MKDTTFVIVSGFFSSGSSAVVDLLKEFKNTYECKAEVRIIKDPYGICQLEHSLVEQWELINSSAAISDFLNLCRICARSGGGNFPFARAGLSYGKTITKDFMDITNEYIDKLTQFKYCQEFYHDKFKKSYLRYVSDRCRYGVEKYSKGKIKIANRSNVCYFSKPTAEEFEEATQEYFERLYDACTDDGGYIILDQAVSPNNPRVIHRYFKKAKMIIVDRDPRDMYVDDIRWGEKLDKDVLSAEAGRRYALRQKALRDGIVNDTDILYMRFEDLILHYDDTVNKIRDFIGFGSEDHIDRAKFLKVERSAANIGIWKQDYEKYKAALDVIAQELPTLCYGN